MKSLAALTAIVLALDLSCAPAARAEGPQILVSAAASLTDVLSALSPQAELFIGAKLLLNFGGSGVLRRQIEEGAPVDVFFSASSEDMDQLQREGLILAETRKDLLSNSIVLIGGPASVAVRPAGTAADIHALRVLLERADLLAIGNPDTVPVGRYAVRALTTYGLYPVVQSKLALGGSVREVLQYVQNGSAPLGIVFATDVPAAAPGSVRQLFVFTDQSVGVPMLYPAAVVSASRSRNKALKMIEFLQGTSARKAFQRAGFTLR